MPILNEITTPLTQLLNIQYPIIQGGMVWVSGAKLAASVSNAGGLGLLSAGSMDDELLKVHIQKMSQSTQKPWGINVPLLYDREKLNLRLQMALSLGVKIFFTSAGSPKLYTEMLKKNGALVFHVASSIEQGLKCQEAGVHGVVLEGFEAGGHNGIDETTSMVLLEEAYGKLSIPFIIAGGFKSGRALFAALSMGASGVQMGTRFLLSKESSAHENFKNLLIENSQKSGMTKLMMKDLTPVRLFKNQFQKTTESIENGLSLNERVEALKLHLGKGKAKLGMLEGNIIEGELEVGQICSAIKSVQSVDEIFQEIIGEFFHTQNQMKKFPLMK